MPLVDIEGYLGARHRLMRKIALKAEAVFPQLARYPDPENLDGSDLLDDDALALAALQLPWYHWDAAFGTLRPSLLNPLTAWRWWRLVRDVKHEIRAALHRRWTHDVRSIYRAKPQRAVATPDAPDR